mgnify:CR=1 FL=1
MDEIYGNSGYNYNRLPYKLITIELDTTVQTVISKVSLEELLIFIYSQYMKKLDMNL